MSVLNLDKKLLYIHIPKTAGTSMEQRSFLSGGSNKHFDIEYYAKFLDGVMGLSLDDLFKFTFVRNPYTRFASGVVGHCLPSIGSFPRALGIEPPITEPEQKRLFTKWVKDNKKNLNDIVALKPQYTFVCIGPNLAVDFVGRFENLKEDWKIICDGAGVDSYLRHELKSRFSSYDSLYSRETREIVAEVYKKDFEMFNYEI